MKSFTLSFQEIDCRWWWWKKDNEALKIQDLLQIKVTAELYAYDPP